MNCFSLKDFVKNEKLIDEKLFPFQDKNYVNNSYEYIEEYVLRSISISSPIDELILFKNYVTNVVNNYKILYLNNKKTAYKDIRQFVDTTTSIINFCIKSYLKTGNFDLSITLFIEQFLKLFFSDIDDYVIVSIKCGRKYDYFKTKCVIEPIISNKDNKISKKEALIFSNFIQTLFGYSNKKSILSISIVFSELWLNDCKENLYPSLYNDILMPNFFEEFLVSYSNLLNERKRILDQRFNIKLFYKEEITGNTILIDKIISDSIKEENYNENYNMTEEHDSVEDLEEDEENINIEFAKYLSIIDDECSSMTSDLCKKLKINDYNNIQLDTEYIRKLIKEGAVPVLSEYFKLYSEDANYFSDINIIQNLVKKYYHENSKENNLMVSEIIGIENVIKEENINKNKFKFLKMTSDIYDHLSNSVKDSINEDSVLNEINLFVKKRKYDINVNCVKELKEDDALDILVINLKNSDNYESKIKLFTNNGKFVKMLIEEE